MEMFAKLSFFAIVLVGYGSVVHGNKGTNKGTLGLENFCGTCANGTVTFTPDEDSSRLFCEKQERKRILSQWYAKKYRSIKDIGPTGLLKAISSASTKICKEKWHDLQCKKHCMNLPNKESCKKEFRFRELPQYTAFLCPRRFDLENVFCIQTEENAFEFVANKCNYCQKLFKSNQMNAIQVPLKQCCSSLQICERRMLSRKWSTYAPICDC